jgi:dipeptidyl aminopeptidase/acylaminoacyl peptidase
MPTFTQSDAERSEAGNRSFNPDPGTSLRGKAEVISKNAERSAVSFKSNGETLRGWLYLPIPSKIPPGKRLPGIVTAHAMTWHKGDQFARSTHGSLPRQALL